MTKSKGYTVSIVAKCTDVTEADIESELRKMFGKSADIYVRTLENPDEDVKLECPDCKGELRGIFIVPRSDILAAGGWLRCETCDAKCVELN